MLYSHFVSRPKIQTGLCVALIAFGIGGIASAQTLESTFSFQVVELGSDGAEQLVSRQSVAPGETIQYALSHKNTTQDDLRGLVISAPVPVGVTLQQDAFFSSIDARFEVQAELNPQAEGLEWSTLPALRWVVGDDGSLREEPVPQDEITAVRWTLSDPLEADATVLNGYRVLVD